MKYSKTAVSNTVLLIICFRMNSGGSTAARGTVLVFLPGLPEIKQFDQMLQEYCAKCKLVSLII